MQDIIPENIGTEDISAAKSYIDSNTEPIAPAAAAEATTDETEQKLTAEITELWAVHTDAQSTVKRTQSELKLIRQSLGERLHAMKQLLARPGRAGQWSSFLAAHQISRTTADRLCAAYAKKLNPDANGTDGSIRELSDEEIAELAKSVWTRLQKKLGTKHAAYAFLGRLVAESGLGNFKFHRGDQRGLALVDPDAVSAAPSTDASATAPTSAA